MSQVTWRASDELVERVRRAAAREGRSLNEYLTRLAQAATNPDLADTELERLRERLLRAGLLAASEPGRRTRTRPDRKALAKARRAAGRGRPLSDLVAEDRE